jgi:phosphate:Na+ symporter
VALIHFTFNVIGTALFTAIIWLFREPAVDLLLSLFPGNDPMSLQMRVSAFHVVFNVSTTLVLLPFVRPLVNYSCAVIQDKKELKDTLTLKFVDERLLSAPHVAMMQVKKEIDYMLSLVEENSQLAFVAMDTGSAEHDEKIRQNETIIDFTNSALTHFLIKLSVDMPESDENIIGSYFHVLNDLERIGDHAENFHEIGMEMISKKISFSEKALSDIGTMRQSVLQMFTIAKDAFENLNKEQLPGLTVLEDSVDSMKKNLIANHFARLAEGNCSIDVSPYYSSVVVGLERVADHLVNVGYSIVSPIGSQKEEN